MLSFISIEVEKVSDYFDIEKYESKFASEMAVHEAKMRRYQHAERAINHACTIYAMAIGEQMAAAWAIALNPRIISVPCRDRRAPR